MSTSTKSKMACDICRKSVGKKAAKIVYYGRTPDERVYVHSACAQAATVKRDQELSHT